jgi:hypothetical protein
MEFYTPYFIILWIFPPLYTTKETKSIKKGGKQIWNKEFFFFIFSSFTSYMLLCRPTTLHIVLSKGVYGLDKFDQPGQTHPIKPKKVGRVIRWTWDWKMKNSHIKSSFGQNRTQPTKLTNPIESSFFEIFYIKIIKIFSFDY